MFAWVTIGAVAWSGGAIAAFVPLVLVEELLLRPAGFELEAGTTAWGVRTAFHPVVWSAFSAAVALVAARWLGIPLAWRRPAFAVLAIGTAIAAVVEFALHEWARLRFGIFDSEYVGDAFLAPGSVVAVALAGWALHAGPAAAVRVLRPVVLFSAVPFAAIGALQLPGLGDGLRTSSIPLASALVVATAYVGVVVISAVRPARR